MNTPEFLLWSIELGCPIRGFEDGTIPERVERQLRAARAVSDARREGRVFEGLVLDPPCGFRADEALAFYGGESTIAAACRDCPANSPTESQDTWAGCFGLLPLPADERKLHDAVETATRDAYRSANWENLCPVTEPRWYGLWLDSPLEAEELLVRFNVLSLVHTADADCQQGIANLMSALNDAYNARLRLHVRLYPRGYVEGTWWKLVPHCPRCRAAWPHEQSQHCAVCGYVGHPAPDKKRRARGRRPYFPLDRLLGEQQAAELLVRYETFQSQQSSPDQGQSQL